MDGFQKHPKESQWANENAIEEEDVMQTYKEKFRSFQKCINNFFLGNIQDREIVVVKDREIVVVKDREIVVVKDIIQGSWGKSSIAKYFSVVYGDNVTNMWHIATIKACPHLVQAEMECTPFWFI